MDPRLQPVEGNPFPDQPQQPDASLADTWSDFSDRYSAHLHSFLHASPSAYDAFAQSQQDLSAIQNPTFHPGLVQHIGESPAFQAALGGDLGSYVLNQIQQHPAYQMTREGRWSDLGGYLSEAGKTAAGAIASAAIDAARAPYDADFAAPAGTPEFERAVQKSLNLAANFVAPLTAKGKVASSDWPSEWPKDADKPIGDKALYDADEWNDWEKPLSPDRAQVVKDLLGVDPNTFFGLTSKEPNGVYVSGVLLDPESKDVIGSISRQVDFDRKSASHSSFELNAAYQGKDIAKNILAKNIDFYRSNGIENVSTLANVDVGGYAWAKYGFVPTGWRSLRHVIGSSLSDLKDKITPEAYQDMQKVLQSDDPRAIWAVADASDPVSGSKHPLGKQLLLGKNWYGKLDLTDQAANERFDAYVGARKK